VKRICLFAAYDPEGVIDDYVIHYLKELSQYADIHYLADCEMSQEELIKITPYTISASAYKHRKYDFGSWSELIQTIGWNEIEKYEELILANDSQYLVGDIGQFLSTMESRNLDFWAGLAVCEEYLGGRIPIEQFIASNNILETSLTFVSSFLVLSRDLFSKAFIRNFFAEIFPVKDRLQVYAKYELGLSRLIFRHKIKFGTFIEDLFTQSSIYTNSAFYFLTLGYPFIKIKVFFSKYYPIIAPLQRFEFIKFHNPDFNKDIVIKHLNRVNPFENHYKHGKQPSSRLSIDRIFRGISKFIYEVSPKFMAPFFKWLIDQYDVYMFETQFFKSKFAYFSKFLTTLPKQKKISKNLRGKKKLIIHFIDARDIISGGMLSINRLVKNSKEIEILSDFETILSGVPLYNPPVEYTYFKQASPQIKFSWIIKYCHPEEVIIHLPEVLSQVFFENLSEKEKTWLVRIPKLQINILNQNIALMPERDAVRNQLSKLTENITITTAHSTYATQQLSNKYTTPVHQLTPFLPEFLDVDFADKEKTILISNDNNLYGSIKISKKDILKKLKDELSEYKFVEIKNLSVGDYKKLIAHSLFTISFGEGFDGYFIEPILSNSLSFAVFNPYYFPSEFLDSEVVYSSWEDLFINIVDDIKTYAQDRMTYEKLSSVNSERIKKYFSNARSKRELENYYKKKYDFVPSPVEFHLFKNIKTKLKDKHNFSFYGETTGDRFVLAPDENVYIDMQGDFYNVLDEIYIQSLYKFDLDEEFILIDIGFHAGIAASHLMKTHKNLKKIYAFEAMLPTYKIGLKNIYNNHFENDVILKPLGLSDHFDMKKIPYIPDWASQMSIEDKTGFYEMYSTSEMKVQIRYIETEIVPAHSELENIIRQSKYKIAVKCAVNGAELGIIQNLDNHNLLNKIEALEIKTYAKNYELIEQLLVKNKFEVEKMILCEQNQIFKLSAKIKSYNDKTI